MVHFELCNITNWSRAEVLRVSKKVVSYFARGLIFLELYDWELPLDQLEQAVYSYHGRSVYFLSKGCNLKFSGPQLQIKTNGSELIWLEEEPRFVVHEKSKMLLPRYKTHLYKAIAEIAEGAKQEHGLSIERDPYALIFPKEIFSTSEKFYSVPVFEPSN